MSATALPEDDEDVIDMQVARILAMTDEEVLADLRAHGIDPDESLATMDRAFQQAIITVFGRPQ